MPYVLNDQVDFNAVADLAPLMVLGVAFGPHTVTGIWKDSNVRIIIVCNWRNNLQGLLAISIAPTNVAGLKAVRG